MSFQEFHFLRPLWLLALLALPLFVWLATRPSRDAGDWRRVIDPSLLPELLAEPDSRGRRRSGLWFAAVWTVASLALAGPAWERVEAPVPESRRALALVLSLSDSMLAGDLRPDRLTRARLKLADLIAESRGQHLGLVVYAGDAFTVAPVTDDGNTLLVQLELLHPELMPVAGSRPDLGILRAADLLRDAGFPDGDIVLLADSADAPAAEAAAAAAGQGLRVSVLAFGTAEGAPVPLASGGFQRDASGNIQIPRFDAAALEAVARAGGGDFLTARADRSDVLRLAGTGTGEVADGDRRRSVEQFLDRGPWLTLALLPLALVAWRRGLAVLVLVLILPLSLPRPAQAIGPKDLWERKEQQAHAALLEGDHARARALADDPWRRGAAAFRQQDFEAAIAAFSGGEGASDRYNLGNALAQTGRYEEAMAAWEEALRIDPGLEDAQANLDAVREWLDRQQQQGEGGQGEPADNDGEAQDGERREGESAEDDGNRDGEDGESRQGDPAGAQDAADAQKEAPGDSSQGGENDEGVAPEQGDVAAMEEAAEALAREMEAAMNEQQAQARAAMDPAEREAQEQQQMVEQWLRRVPDDPGALLRRKFALEHRRRQIEGREP